MPRVAIGIDIGGTKISAGVVDEHGALLATDEMPSDIDDAASVCGQIATLVERLQPGPIAGVGIGAAGIVDHDKGYYLFGPNTNLRDIELGAIASDVLGLPVRVDNDANCAAWAEHRFGVGRGCRHFICVTLGTGIGGGFVFNGRPYRGARGAAAEIGHVMVDPDGPLCGCGRRGCWEQYASGTALERMSAERGRELDGRKITELARGGDPFARELVNELASWIGWGLGSLSNALDPERIAIAGGIARDWDLFSDRAAEALLERMEASDRRPPPDLVAAELSSDAGIVGAALLILDAPD